MLLEHSAERPKHPARIEHAVAELLGDESSIRCRSVDDAVQDLTQFLDERGNARRVCGARRAGARAAADAWETTAAFVKAGAGATGLDLDADGFPVLFRELALFAARGGSELQTGVKEKVVSWSDVSNEKAKTQCTYGAAGCGEWPRGQAPLGSHG